MSGQVNFRSIKEALVKANKLGQLLVNIFSVPQINNIYKQDVVKHFIYNSIIGNSNTITIPAL